MSFARSRPKVECPLIRNSKSGGHNKGLLTGEGLLILVGNHTHIGKRGEI